MKRLPSKSESSNHGHSAPDHGQANHNPNVLVTVSPDQERRLAAPVQQPLPMLKLLRFPAVHERTGLSRSTIWRLEQRGAFPKHRRISSNTVAWVEGEVTAWIHSKVGDIAV